MLTKGRVLDGLGVSLPQICASYVIGGAIVGAIVGVVQPLLTTRRRVMTAGAALGCAFMFGQDAAKYRAAGWSGRDALGDALIGIATGIPIALNIFKYEMKRSGSRYRRDAEPGAGDLH